MRARDDWPGLLAACKLLAAAPDKTHTPFVTSIGELTFDSKDRTLSAGGKPIALTPWEEDFVEALFASPGTPVASPESFMDGGVFTVRASRLRSKIDNVLGDGAGKRYIVSGKGGKGFYLDDFKFTGATELPAASGVVTVGALQFNTKTHEMLADGKPFGAPLSQKARKVLAVLFGAEGQPVTREEIMERVGINSARLYAHITSIRLAIDAALGKGSGKDYIGTATNETYVLHAPKRARQGEPIVYDRQEGKRWREAIMEQFLKLPRKGNDPSRG